MCPFPTTAASHGSGWSSMSSAGTENLDAVSKSEGMGSEGVMCGFHFGGSR